MKKFAIFTLLALLCSSLGFAEKTGRLEAFPGAEGYGRYTTGGRGGKVYKVTKLDDDGSEGTFRWACNQGGPRTIVFDISGTIHLTSALSLNSGDVTIAGQTAPGDGICVADYPFQINANNVIIRFMRFRLGNKNVTENGADGWDALGALDKKYIIVDHCSVCWSIDECLSFSGVENTTVQWCIVSQSLVNSGHSKGAHGYGGNWGGKNASYHHNIMAHHVSRAPRLGPRPTTQLEEHMDMRNNVIYNYSGEGCYGGEGMLVNIVNNYYIPGPGNKYVSASGSTAYKKYRIAGIGIRNNAYVSTYPSYAPALHLVGAYYVTGNTNKNFSEVTNNNWDMGVYNQIDWSDWDDLAVTAAQQEQLKKDIKLNDPINFEYTTTHTAASAYAYVTLYAGAGKLNSLGRMDRDAYDACICADVQSTTAYSLGTGTGLDNGFINGVDDIKYPTSYNGKYDPATKLPILNSTAAPVDTDGDGIPDDWEKANGLNPNDAADGAVRSASGYTNLEVYMNSLVQDLMNKCNTGGSLLTGQMAYGEAPVSYPEFDINLYDPAQDPQNMIFSDTSGDDEDASYKKIEVNPRQLTMFDANTILYEDDNIKVTNAYASSGTNNAYDYNLEDEENYIKFTGCFNLRTAAPTADNVTGDLYGSAGEYSSLVLEIKNPMTISGYVRTGDNKKLTMFRQSPFEAINHIASNHDSREGTDTRWVFTWNLTPGVYTMTESGGGGRFSGFTYELSDASGIEDIVIDQQQGNGKIYNVMGIEVKEPLAPGIYIRDGKKFLVK